jgi:hypothetical protein
VAMAVFVLVTLNEFYLAILAVHIIVHCNSTFAFESLLVNCKNVCGLVEDFQAGSSRF